MTGGVEVSGTSSEPDGRTDVDDLVDRLCDAAAECTGDVDEVVAAAAERLAPLADDDARHELVARAIARLDGLDVLERYLADPDVDEVIVHRGIEVWIERDGRLAQVDRLPPGTVDVVVQRAVSPLGRRLDRTEPVIDARLPDGSRLCAVIAPVAVDGSIVAIRRHRLRHIPIAAFAPPAVGAVLGRLVRCRANVLVTGATSSGKTTLLAALLGRCHRHERIVAVEDTAELDLPDRHLVRLETRRATADGVRSVDAAELVRTALRLRPDRLVVGEFRGDEALAALQALNTGHDGSLATCHANSALDGLRRLEGLVLQAAPAWPMTAIRRQVTRSVDAVVHVERRDGRRTIAEIVEPIESDGEPDGRVVVDRSGVVGEFTRGRR